MIQFLGVLRYIILKSLYNIYLLFVFLGSSVILVIYITIAKEIDFKNVYPYYNAFNFLILLILGAGIIGGEIYHGHIELIFTKPIKRGLFFLYKYLSTLVVSFLTFFIFIVLSLFVSIFFYIFFQFPVYHLLDLLKLLFYMIINQITALSLLFFISSWTSGSLDSFLLLGGVIFYPMLSNFLASGYPSLKNFLFTIKDLLNPFKIEPILAHGFSVFSVLFHWFIYPISLIVLDILNTNKKELSR